MDTRFSKDQVIFGLDIGTRSVVGIVGYKAVGSFNVIADYILEHDTRSMIDGQIHDVTRVANTIQKVKSELENQIGFPLKEVSIAAAGRVLKTCQIHVEQEVDANTIISSDRIYALELLGIEKAHQEIQKENNKEDSGFHCVGYSVTNYYLNGYEISKLENHKGKRIGADVLATFLPKEVVESLYQVVHKAGLEVKNLTLEPIAAIDVAIPPNYRLLNIALVDIGAGTSDIAITKGGSIIAYGMIPIAGDEITESLVHQYLIDFKTAEKVKIKSSGRSKEVSFKDILGMKHKVNLEEVREKLLPSMTSLVNDISSKIMSLNNNHPTNAVFIVGGGGQLRGFDNLLADALNIGHDRVALRGKEVLDSVTFETARKKGPEMVTPIGICYTSMDSGKYDFIQVFFNDEPVKVFNANTITVMDIAAFKGYDPRRLLVSRGEDLTFDFNARERVIKGEPGIPPKILINSRPASMSDTVVMNDYISIIDAKKGQAASISTNQLRREIKPITISINNETYTIKPSIKLNGEPVQINYDIKQGDIVDTIPATIKEAFVTNSIAYNGNPIYVNGPEKTLEDYVYENDLIMFDAYSEPKKEQTVDDKSSHTTDIDISKTDISQKENPSNSNDISQKADINDIIVIANGQLVTLKGKKSYVFVDIFDYIEFDRSKPQGNIVCLINKEKAGYMDTIKEQDIIDVYWSN